MSLLSQVQAALSVYSRLTPISKGHILVITELLKCITELADELARKSVESLGSVEVQDSDAYECSLCVIQTSRQTRMLDHPLQKRDGRIHIVVITVPPQKMTRVDVVGIVAGPA
jgi:hypothetical protein